MRRVARLLGLLALSLGACADVPRRPVVLPDTAQFEGESDAGTGRLELLDDGSFHLALHFAMLDVRWNLRGASFQRADGVELEVYESDGHPRLLLHSLAMRVCLSHNWWPAVAPGTRFQVRLEGDVATVGGPCVPFRLTRVP